MKSAGEEQGRREIGRRERRAASRQQTADSPRRTHVPPLRPFLVGIEPTESRTVPDNLGLEPTASAVPAIR